MLLSNLLFFLISLSVAAITILFISLRLGFQKNAVFFSFLPLLFVYLGFISTVLSIFQNLNAINFIVLQWALLSLLLIDIYKHYHKFHVSNVNTLIKTTKNKISFSSDFITYSCFLLTVLLLLTSFLLRTHTPLDNFDDRMYRASTPLYWVQNKSIFRFETVNERKNVFIMGTGLIYMWPNLFHSGEQSANTFYWLAYPLCTLAIFLFSGLFTQNSKVKAVSVLLFVSAPIIMQYFTYIVIQESWLGLLLLSYFYFLILETRSQITNKTNSLFLGLTLGVLFFLKPTALVYLLSLIIFITIKQDKITRLLWLFVGFMSCIILSGYILFSYQNTKLYGTPYGSEGFLEGHLAQITYTQLTTHLARSPFVFIEFPLFSKQLTKNFELWLQNLSEILGATTELPRESKYWVIGNYQYHFSSPNTRFSLGGIVWAFIFFIHIKWLIGLRNKEKKHDTDSIIVSIVLTTVVIQLFQIRWAEGSGVPYKHLLSSFVLISGFFSLYLGNIYHFFGKRVSFFLFTLLLFSSSQLFLTNMDSLDFWWNKKPEEYESNRFAALTTPYSDFMGTLNSSNSFLIVEAQDALDYPLFWYNWQNQNKVFLLNNRKELDSSTFAEIIRKEAVNKHVQYVVLYNQPNDLRKELLSSSEKYFLVQSLKTSHDNPVDILRTPNN